MRGLHPAAVGVDVIERHTRALAELGGRLDPSTPVPTCGDWTMADLLWHLTEVQMFWIHAISNRPVGPDTYTVPVRPVEAELADRLSHTCDTLVAALSEADPAEQAWSWSDDHTVGFTLRRQSHEALVHHVDGVLATDEPLPEVPSALAADGIDELVDVMLTGVPDWAEFTPAGQTVRVDPDDDAATWVMSLGHVSGTSTLSGTTYDALSAAEREADDTTPDLTIGGSSRDLLLWLWGRQGGDHVGFDGERAVAEALRSTITSVTQ